MDFSDKLKYFEDHFQDADSAIKEYFTQILNCDYHNRPDLTFSPIDDVKNLMMLRRIENERAVSFSILAAIESWFKIDCESRAKKQESSPFNESFKKIYDKSGKTIRNISLTAVINAWIDAEPAFEEELEKIKNVFDYRHWLAHGRHGELDPNLQYAYKDVKDIANFTVSLLIDE